MDNDQLLQAIDAKLNAFKEEIAAVIAGNAAELHTQIQGVEDRLTKRMDATDAILQESRRSWISGAKALAAYMETSLRQDTAIADLTKRLDALEQRLRGAA